MRALLVSNPKATTTSARARDVVAHALASEVKLDVAETTHRGHAVELAHQAVLDGLDVVVALGGDGTVNEVVNGLLSDGPGPDGARRSPSYPAGSTNVFARAIGLPNSPIEATSQLLEGLLADRRRTLGLALADDRWFTFNAGLGLDAGAVRRVEAARAKGKPATQPLYVRSAIREYFFGPAKKAPLLTLERPGRGAAPAVAGADLPGRPVDLPRRAPGAPLPRRDLRHRAGRVRPARAADRVGAADAAADPRRTGARPKGKHVVGLHDLDGLHAHRGQPAAVPAGRRRPR